MGTHVQMVVIALPLGGTVEGREKQVRTNLELGVGISFATLVGQAHMRREEDWKSDTGLCCLLNGPSSFLWLQKPLAPVSGLCPILV